MAYVSMRINIEGDTLPSQDELELRWAISDLIEERGIGEVLGSGGGRGEMDIGVEVADSETAISKLRAIAAEHGLSSFTFSV